MDTSTKKVNPLRWFVNYLRESKGELHKVTWPTKQETTTYTIVVIVLSVLIAGFFGGLDWLLNIGLETLIGLTS